jgi:hypothetical protein
MSGYATSAPASLLLGAVLLRVLPQVLRQALRQALRRHLRTALQPVPPGRHESMLEG